MSYYSAFLLVVVVVNFIKVSVVLAFYTLIGDTY